MCRLGGVSKGAVCHNMEHMGSACLTAAVPLSFTAAACALQSGSARLAQVQTATARKHEVSLSHIQFRLLAASGTAVGMAH